MNSFFKVSKNRYLKWLVYPLILLILASPFIYLNEYVQPVHTEVILDKMKTVDPQGKITFNFITDKKGVLVVPSSIYYKYDIKQSYSFSLSTESKKYYIFSFYLFLAALLTFIGLLYFLTKEF